MFKWSLISKPLKVTKKIHPNNNNQSRRLINQNPFCRTTLLLPETTDGLDLHLEMRREIVNTLIQYPSVEGIKILPLLL